MKFLTLPLILAALQAGGPQAGPTDAAPVETPTLAEQSSSPVGDLVRAPNPIPAPIDVAPETGLNEARFDEAAAIAGAEQALNSLSSATGRFVQIAPDGSVSSGDFAVRRPGRLHFAYDAPMAIEIVSDGSSLAIVDRDLETVDAAPLSATPLGMLLKDDIDLRRDADILGSGRFEDEAVLRLRDKSGEADGELFLAFDAETFALRGWSLLDSQGGMTEILLQDVQTDVRIDPRRFRIIDPSDLDRR